MFVNFFVLFKKPYVHYDVSDGDVNIKAVAAYEAEDGRISKDEVCGEGMAYRIGREYVQQLTVDQLIEIVDADMAQQIKEIFGANETGVQFAKMERDLE